MKLANRLSVFRILLIPFFVLSVVYYRPEQDYLRFVALGIFSLAVISDALDGYIARTKKQRTKLGIILDPLADKLLLSSGFICLSTSGFPLRLPLWVPIVVISRDVILVLGSVVTYMIAVDVEISPTKLGKMTTIFQSLTIISLLLLLKISMPICYIAIFFTIISFIGYIKRGCRLLSTAESGKLQQ